MKFFTCSPSSSSTRRHPISYGWNKWHRSMLLSDKVKHGTDTCSPSTGKTRFVRQNKDTSFAFVDGDGLISVPHDRPDPSDWTAKEREEHMRGFQTHILQNPGSICIAFSEVSIKSFDTRGIPTVAIEVLQSDFNDYIECRHNNLRKGCNPRPNEYYQSQRIYIRKLTTAHGIRIYTSFVDAVAAIKGILPFVVPFSHTDDIKNMITNKGFCVVPNLLSPKLVEEVKTKQSALFNANTKLSKHLSNSDSTSKSTTIPLSDTIHQYLNPHLYQDSNKSTFHVAKQLLSFMDKLLGVKADEHAYLFNDTLLTKTRDHKCRLHWHQDFPFWPLQIANSEILVVWVPLVPVRKDNGAVSIAVGSHKLPVGPLINLSTGVAENHQVFDSSAFGEACLELNAGDCILFSPNLYHMSHPNISDSKRVAWSSTWANPNTQWDPSRVSHRPRSKEVKQGAKLGAFDWERHNE